MNVEAAAAARARTLERPSGTVALLFTDIEGSTVRWDRHREAMQEALRRHDALVREALERHHGFVFKTIGDAFCAVFPTVPQAIAAALDAQRALVREDWRAVDGLGVRMAAHVGSCDERDGDYFGPAVNRVARLLGVAHGGQVIVSSAAADLARDALPRGTTLADCGMHRLKDLTRPERVFQVVAEGLPERFPPLRSLDASQHNLPVFLNAFVGRESEVAQIERLLERQRLISLVGAGGVGKTRAAVHVAAEVALDYPDGVWFVELAPLVDAETIAPTLAALFAVVESDGNSLLRNVVYALRFKRLLLLFDNCEHLIERAAATLEAILHGAPDVRILATSREALGVAGECVFRMPSLALVPLTPDRPSAESVLRYSSVALFVERARAVLPDFTLSDDDAATVAGICRRLDGIALAIELAAARLRMLTPAQLAERLSERFRVLTGGSRTALPRQQTMRALIDWSHDLLSEREREIFRRLAIFNDGFTLEAALEVCAPGDGDAALPEWDVLDSLSALVDKSLVVGETEAESKRFRLLESTREYARERLEEAGEVTALARRHAAHYTGFALRLAAARRTMSDGAWLELALGELENVRAALDWSVDGGNDVPLGADLIFAFVHLWTLALRGEGARRARDAFDRLERAAHPLAEAKLLATLAVHASFRPERVDASYRALEAARSVPGEPGLLSFCAMHHARNLLDAGSFAEAKALLEEALALERSAGDARSTSITLTYLADIARWTGDARRAGELFAESIELATRAGAERAQAVALGCFAEHEADCGRPEVAASLGTRSLRLFGEIRDVRNVIVGHCNLAGYALARDDYAQAREHVRAALRMLAEQLDSFLLAIAVEHGAVIDAAQGNLERAARLLGFAEARYLEHRLSREKTELAGFERLSAQLAAHFAPPELERHLMLGANLSEEAVLLEALA